jgi:hypothetical protein
MRYVEVSSWKAPGRVGLSASGMIGGASTRNAGGNVGLRNGGRKESLRFYD